MNSFPHLKIAIVCDWLTNLGGAERVVLALHKLFPSAPIYTALYNKKEMDKFFKGAKIKTSFLQKIPLVNKKHQLLLKWLPLAFENFDLGEYDIVISSSHSCAKGIITKPKTLHVSYCHSPMRYAWDNFHEYLKEYPLPKLIKKVIPIWLKDIRIWDRLSADRVDYFIANSSFISKRIKKYYRRESEVIHPPVSVKKFRPTEKKLNKKYYLAVGRFTPYKRFDLIIEAFNTLGLSLKIVGGGAEEKKLKKMAKENIEFTGRISDEKVIELYQNAKALIFPQVEDFGIVPLEAMAAGCPVIALKKGGALETVFENQTGLFFKDQTKESLMEAVQKFEETSFNPHTIEKYIERFDTEIFNQKIVKFLEEKWRTWKREMC